MSTGEIGCLKCGRKSGLYEHRDVLDVGWTQIPGGYQCKYCQPPEHIEQFFAYEHLPETLRAVSKPFGELAKMIVETLPRNPERTVALRKLLEAKDAAVRAKIAK